MQNTVLEITLINRGACTNCSDAADVLTMFWPRKLSTLVRRAPIRTPNNGYTWKRILALAGTTVYRNTLFQPRYLTIWISRAASPRLANARLGSAHASSDRRCGQIEVVNVTVLPSDALKIDNAEGQKNKPLRPEWMNQLQNDVAIHHTFSHMAQCVNRYELFRRTQSWPQSTQNDSDGLEYYQHIPLYVFTIQPSPFLGLLLGAAVIYRHLIVQQQRHRPR